MSCSLLVLTFSTSDRRERQHERHSSCQTKPEKRGSSVMSSDEATARAVKIDRLLCVVTVLRDREQHPDPFDAFSHRCTGERYAVNPDDVSEGFDVVHVEPCAAHPDARIEQPSGGFAR